MDIWQERVSFSWTEHESPWKIALFSSPSLPPVLRLIRQTLISLLFSSFLDFFLTANFSQRCFLPLCKKKIAFVFRGLQSIIVIFIQLFSIQSWVCLCCKLESWQAFQWDVSEVTGTASASKMALNWLKSLKLSQRSKVVARCIYKVNNWRRRRVGSLSWELGNLRWENNVSNFPSLSLCLPEWTVNLC